MKNKTCIIVGFGSGVAFGLAKAFASEGFNLALLSRNPDRHAALIGELRDGGTEVASYPADSGDAASLSAAIIRAEGDLGETGVLIYNAVSPTFVKPTALSVEQLVADFRVNVAGALVAAQQVLPGMKTRNQGTILFTGGGWALHPWDQAASPSIGKAGIRSLAYTLAQELADTGIHVGTVTICGQVVEGTHFAPNHIAEAYLKLHRQAPGGFETEIVYQ